MCYVPVAAGPPKIPCIEASEANDTLHEPVKNTQVDADIKQGPSDIITASSSAIRCASEHDLGTRIVASALTSMTGPVLFNTAAELVRSMQSEQQQQQSNEAVHQQQHQQQSQSQSQTGPGPATDYEKQAEAVVVPSFKNVVSAPGIRPASSDRPDDLWLQYIQVIHDQPGPVPTQVCDDALCIQN